MDEQVIDDLYNRAVSQGYKKSRQEFIGLLHSDNEVMNDMYSYVQSKGYMKDMNQFKSLVGATSPLIETPAELKKKDDTTALPSGAGSSVSSASADPEALRFAELVKKQGEVVGKRRDEPGYVDPRKTLGMYPTKEQADKATTQAMADIDATKGERKEPSKGGGQGYVENLFTNIGLGAAYFNEGIASIPETAINLLAIPQNFVAEKTGWDIGVTAEGIKKSWGITNPLLDYVQEDKKILSGEVSKFIAERYEDPSVVGNFEKGNYKDGFELLGSAIAQSLPTSIALMVGGAKMTPAQLTALSTIVFTEGQRQELAEMDPTMPEAEKTFKAVSMAAMEGVFSSLGTGTIGKVYKDILKREGAEAAPRILKDGLVAAYTKALEKMGPVAGFLGNSIEETAVQISQNVIAGRPAFEGAADAFVIGGGQGVVFTAPIGAINAKRYVQGKVESYQTKDKIGQILKDKSDDIDNLYNVPVSSEITAQQLEISNLPKSREILVNRLKKAVADNKITESDAKQSLFVFDKTQQVSNAVKDLDITVDDKAKIATLLRQRDDLKTKIQNKDDVLVVQEKQQIEDINNQIEQILLKPKEGEFQEQAVVESGLTPEERIQQIETLELELKADDNVSKQGGNALSYLERTTLEEELQTLKAEQDAFQKQAAGEVPVQSGATVSQEVAQGEPQAGPQVTAEAGVQEEVITDDQIVEYNPTEEVSDRNNEVLGKVLKSKKFEPQAEPLVSDLGDSVVFEYNNFDENETRTRLTFKKKKDGTITGVGVKLEENAGDVRGTDLFRNYVASKKAEQLQITKQDTNEAIPTERVQPEPRAIQLETKATTKPAKSKGPARVSPKRDQVKSSIQRIANAGLLRSAETGKQAITEQEIDAQMALTDAMARVWQETSGKDNFYETFFEDVKEGNIDAIKQKGGALFQSAELPQLPVTRVTLAVFELPEFQKMKGNMVAPQAVSDLMKSRGKQIEKDIINTVLSYDKYQGQKRISFDNFKDDVETQLMKLERIDTNTYASYGMDNLGDEQNYGTAQTIIFNSPIDHGQFGHFRGDFNNRAIQVTTWNIRQVPNTEQYVAIDANMPEGVEQNEIAQYVGTAGPLADVQRWVNDRNSVSERDVNVGLFGHIRNWFNRNTGIYTLAELQSDYFQKNKANDLYASKIPQEEIDEYMNKNFRSKLDKETREILKKELDIETRFELDENGKKIAISAFKKSFNDLLGLERIDSYTTPPIGYDVIDNAENRVVIEAGRVLARQDNDLAKKFRELQDDYEIKRRELKKEEYKYIAKRVEEVKKSEAGNLMLSQFVASQKVHELRLFRESLKHAADKGATELWFPTPYTIAVIEGYVSDKGTPPYEIIRGDDSYLEIGDLIDYGGTRMIVVESGGDYITVAPRDEVSIFDIDDLRRDEVDNRLSELEYDLNRQVSDKNAITREEAEDYQADEWMSENIKDELNSYFENNPEEDTVAWRDIESAVSEKIESEFSYMTPSDLLGWAGEIYEDGDVIYAIENRRSTENLGQPSEYQSDVDETDFEDNLSSDQSTVVNKYGELGEMIRKMRPDAEVVKDNNGKSWIRTSITAADASNPVIAFQEEGGKIKGAIDFSNDNKASVYVFDGADISTLTHEMSGHLGRRVLEKLAETNSDFAKDYENAKKWAGVKDNQWTRSAEEKWARGFEKYLRSGKAPSKALKNVFEKLRDWLTNIYKTIKGSSIDIKLTPSITSVFDNLLATKAEQGKVGKQSEDIISAEEKTGVLETAFDFLDSIDKGISKTLKTQANEALLGVPLTIVQGMVKSLKVLVQGGMKLRDAIKKVAAENNISQEKLKELLDLGAIAQEFNALMTKADKLIAGQKRKGIEPNRIVSNLDTMVRKFYQDMDVTDAQRKIMEREARAKMGIEPRKAASIGRVIGVLKDITNVSRKEKLQIISRIRELGRDVAKDLASEIRDMAKGGTITPNQAANIIAKFGKVNMLNEMSVSNFVDYMAKVFADAEYTNQLSDAVSKRKSLRSLSKNKDKAANLRSLASKFTEIDPSMVDDIYEYNRIAKLIDESIRGSSIRGKDVRFADIVQEGKVIPYINKTIEVQREKLYEERLKEVRDILGVDAEGLSYEDLLNLLSEPKTKGKDNDKVVRDAINKAFEVYSSIINSSIETGVDPISGEKVSYTDSQKKLISQFMDMDLGLLSPKQALEAVDGLLNFIQNNSTAKMEAILKGYTGVKNAAELVRKGVKASPLRKYFSKGLGRFFGEQTTNLGLLFERLFKGFEAGGVVQDAMGLTDLINGKSQAQIESNRITNDYVSEFYKKKANGEAFNTELNNVERGMAAWMMRNVIGTEAEIKAEFQRRKDLILKVDKDGNRTGSIAELESGNEKEQAKAKVYQEVYDKILDGAKTIDDVMSKVDAVNLDAVKFWQDQWQNKYDELADVSLNVYNKSLEKDINYTPDKYSKLSTSSGAVEITENDMAFHVNNGTLYDKETGVLMEATRPESLPVDNTTGEVDRYIDLSFDSNNANSMYDALVDIKTAGPIRQVQAFLNSKSFKKIFPQAEDATILKGDGKSKRIGRIELFTRNFRNKNPYSEDEFSNAVRNLNRLANVGVGQALGGVFQPIKQVIPVGMNTLINGGGLDIDAMTNPAKIKFMMDSGYAIGVRGVESQAQVESLNKLMDMAAKSRGEKAMKYIEEANKIWLKIFLVKPDVFIARASWMTYYEQSLGKQGIDAKGIDYNTHELNEKAANYAQRMVDRQQNVSDADLSGKLFAEKNPSKQVMMKIFMPFASFRMNQSARIGADIATITSKVSTEEDRTIAAKSLAGFAVEMATFRALSVGISLLTASLVAKMMGSDEEDEEKKKSSIIKGQATNTISDVLSPIPFADPFVQAIAATTLQGAQDIAGVEDEDALSIYSPQDKGYIEQLGLFGFAAQRVVQTGELVWLSSVGNYRDSFGKKKYISSDDQDALRLLIGPALLTNVGLAPSEMNSVVRASMSAAKKNSSTKEGGAAGKDYESEMIDRIEEDLLEGYENKSEMKRYNPRLYEQNFGERSEYYELTKEKREEQKKAREEERKEKDAEYGYRGKDKGFGSRSKSSGGGFGAKKFGED
jgi:hypothetical protein